MDPSLITNESYTDHIWIKLWPHMAHTLITYGSYSDHLWNQALITFGSYSEYIWIILWSHMDHILITYGSYSDHIWTILWSQIDLILWSHVDDTLITYEWYHTLITYRSYSDHIMIILSEFFDFEFPFLSWDNEFERLWISKRKSFQQRCITVQQGTLLPNGFNLQNQHIYTFLASFVPHLKIPRYHKNRVCSYKKPSWFILFQSGV